MIDYNVRGNEINILVSSEHCKTTVHHSCLSLKTSSAQLEKKGCHDVIKLLCLLPRLSLDF